MGRIRFTQPSVDRVPLKDDDWIELKHKLNNGEQKKLESVGLKPPMVVGGKLISPIDWETYEIHRVAVFLTAWSFVGFDGKPMEVSIEALKALDTESFDEINKAIYAHIAKVSAEEAAKKELREATKTGSENGATEDQTPTPETTPLPSDTPAS